MTCPTGGELTTQLWFACWWDESYCRRRFSLLECCEKKIRNVLQFPTFDKDRCMVVEWHVSLSLCHLVTQFLVTTEVIQKCNVLLWIYGKVLFCQLLLELLYWVAQSCVTKRCVKSGGVWLGDICVDSDYSMCHYKNALLKTVSGLSVIQLVGISYHVTVGGWGHCMIYRYLLEGILSWACP